jgi:hypothetical protein
MITAVHREGTQLHVRGIAQDDGTVAKVIVNDAPAKIISQHAGVADWEANIPDAKMLVAKSQDAAGNEERQPHTKLFAQDQ